MPQTLRTFIALPLSPSLTQQLTDVQRGLKRECPERAVRWMDPERIHLTLFFIGDILPDRQAPIEAALRAVARNVRPFAFEARGLGCFPHTRRPRVIWVGIDDTDKQLALLHLVINEALESVGFQPETRPYSPHLTLGRVQRKAQGRDVRAVGQVVEQTEIGSLGMELATSLIFFRSVLKSSGAEYSPLATFALEGPA